MSIRILHGDCRTVLRDLPDGSVHCCVCSPPYWGLRDYGVDGQIGLEVSPDIYVTEMVQVFREVRRVLRDDGTLWLNLGDSYAGSWGAQGRRETESDNPYWHGSQIANHPKRPRNTGSIRDGGLKPKDLIGIPWMVAFALRADGWYLRQDNIWAKRNCMPESVSGSQYVRHRIKIGDYEKLFGVPYPGERNGHARASDLSGVQTSEILDREAALSAEPDRESNSAGTRGTSGRSGKTSAGRLDAKSQKSRREISKNGAWTGKAEGEGRPIWNDRQGEADMEEHQSETSREDARGRRISHDSGMVADSPGSQRTMLLLQETSEQVDDGSRGPNQQGRSTLGGERGAGLRELQQSEGGQADPALLIDCPGCDKCRSRDGWVLSMSAGRTTRAHEYVFLFSKSASYFHDSIAIEEEGDIPAGTRAAKGSAERAAENGVNARPPEYKVYTGKRNKRSVWHVATQPFAEAHFATMPPAIVETCVLAGSSEHGCCSACGAPWVRQTEKRDTGKTQKMTDGWDTGPGGHGTIHRDGREKGVTGIPVTVDITIGWLPSCECGADVVPCTILDPFGGAGTTGLVADRLGRNAILIELNAGYIEIAKRRVTKDAGMFAEIMPC